MTSDYQAMAVADLEAEINRFDREIQERRKTMLAIHQIIDQKNAHHLAVRRFEKMAPHEKDAFLKLAQTMSVSGIESQEQVSDL